MVSNKKCFFIDISGVYFDWFLLVVVILFPGSMSPKLDISNHRGRVTQITLEDKQFKKIRKWLLFHPAVN